MIIALAISRKNADTKGKMMNAEGACPWLLVTAAMLATAVGVAPKAKPPNPALSTAARYTQTATAPEQSGAAAV